MTKRTKTGHRASADITEGLNGLLGALNEALGDMMTRLDDGTSGSVERNHTFQTPKGPVRAQAGVRVRMGGFDAGGTPQQEPQPINPDRTAPAPAHSGPRTVPCDVIEAADHWTITADLPGIAEDEVTVTLDGSTLTITAKGRRHYRATCTLGGPGVVGEDAVTLHNGILTLTVQKADSP